MNIIGKAIILGKKVEVTNQVELISFKMDGTLYSAEEGMTLGEWALSSYNTGGWVAHSGYLERPSDGAQTLDTGPNTIIKNGDIYKVLI